MNRKRVCNQRGSATIEVALVFPILLVLMVLFVEVIKINVARAVVSHTAVEKSVKECFGTTLSLEKADISNREMKWIGLSGERTYTKVNGGVLSVSSVAQRDINLPLVGERKKRFESNVYVPVFNDIFGDNANGTGSSVWELMPFDRGRVIEAVFGNNLPDKFEVLDILTGDGLGISIVSIDTTLESYTDGEQLYNKLIENIDKISNFQGDEAEDITVEKNRIKQKKLKVIIPSNGLSDVQKQYIEKVRDYAKKLGIEMEIVEYQEKAIG